jgi:hypothetical protein
LKRNCMDDYMNKNGSRPLLQILCKVGRHTQGPEPDGLYRSYMFV